MKLKTFVFILLLQSVACLADSVTITNLTTTDGRHFTNAKLLDLQGSNATISFLLHGGGGQIRLPLDAIPDDARSAWGIPTRADLRKQRQDELEKQDQIFEDEQQKKGLVKYKGIWISPEKKKEVEANEKADSLILSKFHRGVTFKIIQAMKDGLLCVCGRYSSYYEDYIYDGEVFFLYGLTGRIVADEEKFKNDLYWAGTHSYTTVQGINKTVNSYTVDRKLAREIVKAKFKLTDRPSKGERTRPSDTTQPSEEAPRGFGTGFIITEDGYLLTNEHVVDGATKIEVKTESATLPARLIGKDTDNDLALLKIEGKFTPVTFAGEGMARVGQTVFTVGFPIPDLQGFTPKVTKGVISSTKGIKDNMRFYQIDASVQPGNSGGPLADENGVVIGVVVARLNAVGVLIATGSLPQNVNYAVKKSYAIALLESYPEASCNIRISKIPEKRIFEDAVATVQKSTVLIVVH